MMGGPKLLALICFIAVAELGVNAEVGPMFLQEPPTSADFTNSSGLILPCSAYGNPRPTISWQMLDGSPADDLPGLRRMLPNGTLLFESFSAEDFRTEVHTATYQCVATNKVGTIVSRLSRVRAAVVEQYYHLEVHDAFTIAGNTAVIRCFIPSSVQDYVVVTSWLRGLEERITSNVDSGGRYSVFPTGELHIRNTQADDGLFSYYCETQHLLTGEVTISPGGARLVFLTTNHPLPPEINDSRAHVDARNRQPVELPCAAQGFPAPTYRWFRVLGGMNFPVVPNQRIKLVGGSLYFTSVEQDDSGRYLCFVNNSVGTNRISTNLAVTTPLTAYINPQQQTVDMGRGAQLNCTTEGYPQFSIYWLKDGQPVQLSPRRRLIVPEILRIDSVERSDKGMYQCFVHNHEETAQGTAELRIGDAAPVLVMAFGGGTVRPGGAWAAQCEATGTPLPTIYWLRDGKRLSSEEHRLKVTVHVGAATVRSRLLVSGARPEDGGVYRCVAVNPLGDAQHGGALRVLGPPRVRPMQDRRVVARTDPVFHCRVSGHPISQIRWERHGKPLPENHRQQVYPNGTLVIKNIQKHTDDGGYVCIATNPDGHTSRSKLNIQIIEPPEIDPIAVKSDLHEGMRMHLTCIVRKGDFPIMIIWLKDGAIISRDHDIQAKPYDDYSSILSFNNLTVNHNGNYTCQATNAAAVTNYTVEIIVHDPPSWKIEPNDTETMVGKTVIMPCAADGSPAPLITWKRDTGAIPPLYQDLSSVMQNYKIMENGSLIIYDTIPEDTGHYLCHVTNDIGQGLSKVIHLFLSVPAKFLKPFQNVTAIKGTSVTIDCTAEGDTPISIKWYQGDLQFSEVNNPRMAFVEKKTDKGMTSTLTFKNVDKGDTSLFACIAKNKYGIDRSEIWLYVQEPPEAPLHVRISNYSSRSVDVMWEQPYNGNSPIKSYIIQYKNSSVSWHKNVPQVLVIGEYLSGSITDLMPSHVYNIRVLAENSVGMSNSSDVLTITTLEEVPEAAPRDVKVKSKDSVSLLVTWKPPDLYLQHGEIKGYYIGYRKSDSTETYNYTTYDTFPGMPLQYMLSNLQKYTQYTVFVQAYNKIGAGPRSQEVIGETDEDVPDAPPNDVQCTSLTSQSILVFWSPPPNSEINGILRGYKVLYKALCYEEGVSDPLEEITTDKEVELNKLEHFCNYSVEVQAFTRKGDGVSSQPIFCRTQEDVPNEPENVKAAVTDSRSILVSWLPPLHPNGIIRSYKVYVRPLQEMAMDKYQFDVPADRTHHIVSPLRTDNQYEFWVTAITTAGEGSESRHVVKAPARTAPAKIASFGQHIITALQETLRLSCHAVGYPVPNQYWRKNGKTIEEDSRVYILDDWVLQISPVQSTDAGNYSCSVENIYGRDEIIYYVVVQVPLAPTNLHASSSSVSSITIKWMLPSDSDNKIQGHYLYYKREFGEWDRIKLKAEATDYTLQNLQCGTRYYFYLEAFSQLRHSEPTTIMSSYTLGTAPLAPSTDDLIQHTNTSYISLNLTAWDDGQCPITSFVIEYTRKNLDSWTLVSNNIKTDQNDFLILDLSPGTRYTMRVTAHNSAGSTVKIYEFGTLTVFGGTVPPDSDIFSEDEENPFYTDAGIVTAIVIGLTSAVIVAIVLCVWLRRRHIIISANRYIEKPEDAGQLPITDKRVAQNTYVTSNNDNGRESSNISEPTVRLNPTTMALVHRPNISPYATFQVPVSGGSDIEVESEIYDTSNRQRISKHGSSTDSTYSRIHKGYPRGNDTPEWIPLHNLYQAHRY